MVLIHRMQNGVKLTAGPFKAVNRELCKVVSKNRIYILHCRSAKRFTLS